MGPALPEDSKRRERPIDLSKHEHSGQFPLARLIQLIVLLQTERCPNARRLAEICEVSRRTIYRDLTTLANAGINVVYRPDRQGYELARHLFLQPPRMEDREVLALLVLCRQWGPGDDLGLYQHANRAVDKLVQSLPEEIRMRVRAAAEVLADAPERPGATPQRIEIDEQILIALDRRRQIRLWIIEDACNVQTTKLAIYRLTRLQEAWFLVGRSTHHCGVIVVPLARIERVELTADPYAIPPRFNLERFLARRSDFAATTSEPAAFAPAIQRDSAGG
jgi:predicted DNA-binding transcriptional regulator YafY